MITVKTIITITTTYKIITTVTIITIISIKNKHNHSTINNLKAIPQTGLN
jgi:hypothetical protein